MREQEERSERDDGSARRARRGSGTHVRVREETEPAARAPAALHLVPAEAADPGLLPTSARAAGADEAAHQRASDFARLVLAVATEVAGGADRALVEPVWRAGFADVPLADFKQALFATHKRGMIVLARADLRAHRYPRATLDASEIARSSLRFHFVRTTVPGR